MRRFVEIAIVVNLTTVITITTFVNVVNIKEEKF